mmetsp:Transcript_37574/g.111082  ORF Transcript_37574/g.111082 Transcript_37574/m.111082 type:complete len:162 (-) Transcript_37574:40-525(-)
MRPGTRHAQPRLWPRLPQLPLLMAFVAIMATGANARVGPALEVSSFARCVFGVRVGWLPRSSLSRTAAAVATWQCDLQASWESAPRCPFSLRCFWAPRRTTPHSSSEGAGARPTGASKPRRPDRPTASRLPPRRLLLQTQEDDFKVFPFCRWVLLCCAVMA